MPMIDVTLSTDVAIYASGDVLAEFQAVPGLGASGNNLLLQSLMLIDQADQGIALDLLIAAVATGSPAPVLGAENGVPSISDADALALAGFLSIAGGDYVDLGGARLAFKANPGIMLPPGDIYVGAITRGAPTYGAASLLLRLGLRW